MDIATKIERAKFRCDQIRSPGGIAGEIREGLDAASDALAIVARLPKTSDGVPVICDGMTIYCPKGHEHKLTHPTGRLYAGQMAAREIAAAERTGRLVRAKVIRTVESLR